MPDDPVIDVVDAAPRRGRKPRAQPATGPLDAVEETLDDASADLPEPAVVAPQGRTNMPTAIPEFVLAEPVPVPALTPVTDTLEVLSPLIFAGHRVTRIAWMNAAGWPWCGATDPGLSPWPQASVTPSQQSRPSCRRQTT